MFPVRTSPLMRARNVQVNDRVDVHVAIKRVNVGVEVRVQDTVDSIWR